MSFVSDCIISTNSLLKGEEGILIQEINKYFEKHKYYHNKEIYKFIRLKGCCIGGDKMIEGTLLIAAINSLYDERFIEHLKNIPWHTLGLDIFYVQLFLKKQHDEKWSIIDIYIDEEEIDE